MTTSSVSGRSWIPPISSVTSLSGCWYRLPSGFLRAPLDRPRVGGVDGRVLADEVALDALADDEVLEAPTPPSASTSVSSRRAITLSRSPSARAWRRRCESIPPCIGSDPARLELDVARPMYQIPKAGRSRRARASAPCGRRAGPRGGSASTRSRMCRAPSRRPTSARRPPARRRRRAGWAARRSAAARRRPCRRARAAARSPNACRGVRCGWSWSCGRLRCSQRTSTRSASSTMTTPTAFSAVVSSAGGSAASEQDQRQADQQQRGRVAGAPDGAEAAAERVPPGRGRPAR